MKHNQIRQVVFPILAALIWGTAFVAQDVCADTIGTFTFNAVRYFIAVLALLVLIAVLHATRKDRPQPTEAEKRAGRKQLWLGGFCCGTALAIASNFQQAGIVAGTDAGKAGFLTALYVVLVPVFGLFFKRKVSLPVWVAVALSVVSLYLLCIKGSFRLAAGDLLVLVCAMCFAVHILVIDRFSATCDGVKLSCVQFLFAALWSGVCIPFFEHVDAAALLSCALPLLYVGVFSCGVGVQTISQMLEDKPVYACCDTIELPGFQGVTPLEVDCGQCGQCFLNLTGGICPITACSKSLVNGPCGGTKNGKCEVNPEMDCGWERIIQRLKA